VTLAAGPGLASSGPDGPVMAMIRPEHIHPAGGGMKVSILAQQFLGDGVRVQARAPSGEDITMRLPDGPEAARLTPGSCINVAWAAGAVTILPERRR
jgi:TOBE domain